MTQKAPLAHRLKVTLVGVRPPIWRRLLVPSSATLGDLHQCIQVAMGWWDGHLHEFEVGGTSYGVDDGDGWGPPVKDERSVKLSRIAPEGATFTYTYDFGDNWEHRVEVEAIVDREPGQAYPRCLTGRRAPPPEDCGGPWGYGALLEILADPTHPEYEERREWVGGDLDPEHFDIEAVNKALYALSRTGR